VRNELFGRRRGKRAVEAEHDHRIGAGLGKQALALVEAGQAKGRRVGAEVAHRMGIEGRDQSWPPLRACAGHGAADHRLVPGMKPIEIAERDDPPAKRPGNRRAAVQPLHGRAIGAGAGADNRPR
jgi:hypothetical protein